MKRRLKQFFVGLVLLSIIIPDSLIYKTACDLGAGWGCFYSGALEYQAGHWEGKRLWKKACDLGHTEGCRVLGSVIVQDENNIKEGKVFSKKACDKGSGWGCYDLGNWAKKAGNINEAKIFLKKACDLGNEYGCFFLKNLNMNEK